MSNITYGERNHKDQIPFDLNQQRIGGAGTARIAQIYHPPAPKVFEVLGYKPGDNTTIYKGVGATEAEARAALTAQGAVPSGEQPPEPVVLSAQRHGVEVVNAWAARMAAAGMFQPCPENQQEFERYFAENGLVWSSVNLDRALAYLNAEGKLIQPPSREPEPVLRPRGYEREPEPTEEQIEAQEQEALVESYRRTLAEMNAMDINTYRRTIRSNPRFARAVDEALQWRNAGGR